MFNTTMILREIASGFLTIFLRKKIGVGVFIGLFLVRGPAVFTYTRRATVCVLVLLCAARSNPERCGYSGVWIPCIRQCGMFQELRDVEEASLTPTMPARYPL